MRLAEGDIAVSADIFMLIVPIADQIRDPELYSLVALDSNLRLLTFAGMCPSLSVFRSC